MQSEASRRCPCTPTSRAAACPTSSTARWVYMMMALVSTQAPANFAALHHVLHTCAALILVSRGTDSGLSCAGGGREAADQVPGHPLAALQHLHLPPAGKQLGQGWPIWPPSTASSTPTHMETELLAVVVCMGGTGASPGASDEVSGTGSWSRASRSWLGTHECQKRGAGRYVVWYDA